MLKPFSKTVLAITFLLCSMSVIAQRKSYIITNRGDSLYGDIALNQNTFTVTDNTIQRIVDADDVKEVYAKKYKGHTVVHCRLYQYTDNLSDLQIDYVPTTSIDTVMILQEIYSSDKINLYFGKDKRKAQYYFYKRPVDAAPVQLMVRYSLGGGLNNYALNPAANRGEKSQMHIEEYKIYINQLKNIMGDCEYIPQGVWDVLHYRSYSFINLIKKYNELCD
jgi:hypothetical protein